MKTKFILWNISFVLIFLSGCGLSTGSTLNVKVIAAETKTPLPIHFFTLKSNEVFKKLDYSELVSSKKINWNNELINRAKTLLLPGSTEIFQVKLTPDVQYYALAVGFKDVEDNDNWRYIRAVDANSDNNIALKLSQVNGYTSKAVVKIKENSSDNNMNKHVINMSESISNKVNNKVNNSLDNGINNALGRVFR